MSKSLLFMLGFNVGQANSLPGQANSLPYMLFTVCLTGKKT
jgi:hypothetical protein